MRRVAVALRQTTFRYVKSKLAIFPCETGIRYVCRSPQGGQPPIRKIEKKKKKNNAVSCMVAKAVQSRTEPSCAAN